MKIRYVVLGMVILVLPLINGCALLQIPGQVIGGTFALLGELLKFAGSLPKPPPWVFI